jgi:hypothetical protein
VDANNMIAWNGKLEAYHADGRVMDVEVFTGPDSEGDYGVNPAPDGGDCFRSDGSKYVGRRGKDNGWRIRNKPAAAVSPTEDEWGPAIEVGGVRPAWLEVPEGDEKKIWPRHIDGHWLDYKMNGSINAWTWQWIGAIRLPANHPHYRTEKPATGPNGVLTGVETLERLEALEAVVRGFAANDIPIGEYLELKRRARSLYPTIDPDLIKAREIAGTWSELYSSGEYDTSLAVQAALAGIKAGRDLGK